METNYERLFGTPEKAAKTLGAIIYTCACCDDCEGCPVPDWACSGGKQEMREWLEGEVAS